MIAIRHEVEAELEASDPTLLELRQVSLGRAAREIGLTGSAAQIDGFTRMFMTERDSALKVYEDVQTTLANAIANGWTIVLLTNGNANIASTGLARYFSHTFFAERIGARKPEAGAFQAVADETGCLLSDLVHVGDSLEDDIAGAVGVGATAVWLNRDETVADDSTIRPNFEIRALPELAPILQNISISKVP